jgi:ribose 5-phosphate isomerase A
MVLAAKAVVENHIRSHVILGLGSGSAVAKFAEALGKALAEGKLNDVVIVPSSMQSWLLAKRHSLSLSDSAHCPSSLDVTVDGADQIALPSRAMIKGGGGALLREKILLAASKQSYILVDSSKVKEEGFLDRSVPVEVVPFAVDSIRELLKQEFEAEPVLRTLEKGYPYFTESGNVILDCKFSRKIEDPANVELSIKNLAGVIEVGIFNCKVDKFYVKS